MKFAASNTTVTDPAIGKINALLGGKLVEVKEEFRDLWGGAIHDKVELFSTGILCMWTIRSPPGAGGSPSR